jgi:hypothetical protein
VKTHWAVVRRERCAANKVRATRDLPYVDAMFVDKQCASLLKQGRLRTELTYKAKVFSLNSPNDFLGYLEDICNSTPENIRVSADDIYGETSK